MAWKPAHLVFAGGTHALDRLKERKVRPKAPLQALTFNGPTSPFGSPVSLLPVQVGLIGYPFKTYAIIGFPKPGRPCPDTLQALSAQGFTSVAVDWVAFRSGFDIEV